MTAIEAREQAEPHRIEAARKQYKEVKHMIHLQSKLGNIAMYLPGLLHTETYDQLRKEGYIVDGNVITW